MPSIRDSQVTQLTTEAATISVELPTHETNDLLIVFLSKDAVVTASTSSALGHVWQVDDSGGPSYVDQTTAANSAGASDWGFFPAGAGNNDAVEVGFANPFSLLQVVLGTAGAGTYTVTWQYYNSSSTWTNLTGVVDGTGAFKNAAATYTVSFTIPTDWAPAVINGSASLYWIRAQRNGGTETTRPLGTRGYINQWTETASSGWAIAGQRNGTGCCQMWAYKIATSSSETDPTFSQGDTDSMIAVAVSVSGVHTTYPLDVTGGIGSATAGSGTETISGLATVNNNALCFYVLTEVTGTGPTPEPGLQRLVSDDTASVGLGVGWTFQATAGTPADHVFYCNASSALTGVKNFIALRDDGNATDIPAYHDRGTTLATMVSPITGGAYPYGETVPASLTITTVGAKTATFDAVAATADSGVNPFHSMALITPAATAANLGGSQITMTAKDVSSSTGILVGTYRFTTPRDYIDTGFYKTGGIQLLIGEVVGSNDYKSWMVGAQRAKTTDANNRNWYAIQPAQSTNTTYATSGTPPTLSAITFMQLMQTCPLGTASLGWSQLIFANKVVVAGGSTTNPIDFAGILSVVNGYVMQLGIPQASGAVQMYCPIQFGGSKAVVMDAKNFQIQFPKSADTVNGYMDFHVDPGVVGLLFDGRAGDQIKMRNCLVQSLSKWQFTFAATVSTSCTWDFDGMTVIDAIPTLRNIGTSTTAGFQNMTFVDCDQIVQNSATLTDCTVNGTLHATSALLSNDLATISSCIFTNTNDGDIGHSIQINATGTYTFAGNVFSGGGVAARSFNTTSGVDAGTDFVTTDAAHGYVDGDAIYYQDQGGSQNMGLTDGSLYYVNSQSATTLSFHTTKAFAIADTNRQALTSAGGETHYIYSAKADIYNSSGGAVTINVTSGGDTPTIRNSNSSSTTVNNSVTLEINGVISGTQCYIVPSAGGSALMNEAASTLVSGNEYKATESYNYTGSTAVTVRAREMGYLPFETAGTVTSSGLTVTAVWQVDPNWKLVVSGVNIQFTNPATITRASGNFTTDGWLDVMSQVTVDGSVSNDGTYTLSAIGTTTVTITGATLTNEGPSAGITLTFTRRSLT